MKLFGAMKIKDNELTIGGIGLKKVSRRLWNTSIHYG